MKSGTGAAKTSGGGRAAAADGGDAVGKDKPVRERGKKRDVDDVADEADAGPERQEAQIDYKKFYDVPECPVFYPTAKEFNHPGKYIESISEQAKKFGICKIVPPSSWKPPFMIDHKKFLVRTRVQQVNYLDGQARQRLIFVENLCRFWSKRGQELEKLPIIAQAPLDVCRLYHEVRLRGGMAAVVENKQWAEVARAMDMESSQGSALRTQYQKILLPYEEMKESMGEYRVKAKEGEDEEDEAEASARRELEERLRAEKEEKKRKKEEREKARKEALCEGEEPASSRHTRRRSKLEGGVEEADSDAVMFTVEGVLIGVGSRVSVFWDGDGVSYKGVVVKTCARQGCMVLYDADAETHWENPESIRLLDGRGAGVCEDDFDEGDLPMLDSLGGKGALASLDSLLGTCADMNEVVKSIKCLDASLSVAPDTDREREAGKGGGGIKREDHAVKQECSTSDGNVEAWEEKPRSNGQQENGRHTSDVGASDAGAAKMQTQTLKVNVTGAVSTVASACAVPREPSGYPAAREAEPDASVPQTGGVGDTKMEVESVVVSVLGVGVVGEVEDTKGAVGTVEGVGVVEETAQGDVRPETQKNVHVLTNGHWERDENGARRWVAVSEASCRMDQQVILDNVKTEHASSGVGGWGGKGKMGGGGRMGGGRARSSAHVEPASEGATKEGQEEVLEEDEYRFGYHDGKTYTLQAFRKMANEWKEAHFARTLKKTSDDDVEQDYWRIFHNPETQVEVEYGSELHTTQTGSGFPTHGNPLNPLDSKTTSSFCRSGWNLNNLNECTLLRFVKEDIPGIISPWLYMGMCFSTFCWHNEDHFLYSINYLWEGEPKQWYGVPGDQADLFEQTMREYAPQLFELQPDVLFQLVTMIAPSVLQEKGVTVCRARQAPGEFMVTFPRAYHGGFNIGYNVAESCNFALTDWIPWGLMADRWYRELGRAQVFSYPALLVSLAQNCESVEIAMWLLSDLERFLGLEQQGVHALMAKGVTRQRMETTPAGILTNMLSANAENEAPNTMLDGKRLCAGRMKSSNMSMQDIRRQRESQGQDECCICLGSTFLFLVRCSCSDRRVVCVSHAHRMCTCPLTSKVLEARYSDNELSSFISTVRLRAERPAIWLQQAEELLAASSRGAPRSSMRALQPLVTEAERFPRALSVVWQRHDDLKDALKHAKSWALSAQAVLAAVNKCELKGRGATKASSSNEPHSEPTVSVADIQKLIQDAHQLQVVPDELEALERLLASVTVWRERSRQAMLHHGQQQGLRQLHDTALQQLLADGRRLCVYLPELNKVMHESELRAWLSSLPPMPGTCSLACVQELVAKADAKKLQDAQVEVMRRALNVADTTRSRLQKAHERGTSVPVLRSLLSDIARDKENAKNGLIIELEEEKNILHTLDLCEAWSSRVTSMLAGGDCGREAGGNLPAAASGSVAGVDENPQDRECRSLLSRPLLKDLEKLQDEYQAIGVYIEVCEGLRRRIETAHAWRRKALRILPLAFAPPPHASSAAAADADMQLQESTEAAGSDGAEAVRGGEGGEPAALAARSVIAESGAGSSEVEDGGAVQGAHASTGFAENEPGAGSKRSASKRDRERETKKMRKSDGGGCLGPASGGGSVRVAAAAAAAAAAGASVATAEQVVELLLEEGKLRVRVEEADALRARLDEHTQWCTDANALISHAPSLDAAFKCSVAAHPVDQVLGGEGSDMHKTMQYFATLSAALETGEALGIVLGEEGRKVRLWLWGVRVGRTLAAGTGKYGAERDKLMQLQVEGSTLEVEVDSPIIRALATALQQLEALGCVCGSNIDSKGPMLTCVGCHKKLHPTCVGLHPSDPRIASAGDAYSCAPCRRKGRTSGANDAWMQAEEGVRLKLPDGWYQTVEPSSGCLIFLEQSAAGVVTQAVRTAPAGSLVVIPSPPNACLARAPDTAKLCQVCFEVDDPGLMPDEGASVLGGKDGADKASTSASLLASIAQEAARERGQLLQCVECGVRVHQGCYVGPPLAAGSVGGASLAPPAPAASSAELGLLLPSSVEEPFFCRPCEYAVRNAACILCGLAGGAMSPATCGGWAHVSCALWAAKGSAVGFQDRLEDKPFSAVDAEESGACNGKSVCGGGADDTMTCKMPNKRHSLDLTRVLVPECFKIVETAAASKDAKESSKEKRRASSGGGGSAGGCRFCPNSRPGGVLVKCQEKGCKCVAHPVCAFEHGWYLFLETRDTQGTNSQVAQSHDKGEGGRRSRDKKGSRARDDKVEIERLVFCQEHAPQEDDDEDEKLYCICQRRYKEGEWMIECEACHDWFHGPCVGVLESAADTLVDWHCPRCAATRCCPLPSHTNLDVHPGAVCVGGEGGQGSDNTAPPPPSSFVFSPPPPPPPTSFAAMDMAGDLSLLLNLAGQSGGGRGGWGGGGGS